MEALFLVSAVVSLIGTLILVTQKNAIYALLGLLLAFIGSAGVFLALDAVFIAISQILIYAGALAVMFLFILMFTDTRTLEDMRGLPKSVGARPVFDPRITAERERRKKKKHREEIEVPEPVVEALQTMVVPKPFAVVVALSLLACISIAIFMLPDSYNEFGDLPVDYDQTLFVPSDEPLGTDYRDGSPAPGMEFGSTRAISRTIFEGFPLAFEVVSLLIFMALLGAVLLARRHLTDDRLRPEEEDSDDV
jgi:NADH:ubiquinone oxidoreductase subunit 6 (subunit J)